MTRPFRAQLVLMLLNRYGYGNHVDDPNAFVLRVESYFKNRDAITLYEDYEGSI